MTEPVEYPDTPESQTPVDVPSLSGDAVTLATAGPWTTLSSGVADTFPDITPSGTVVTPEQADAARVAAQQVGIPLIDLTRKVN